MIELKLMKIQHLLSVGRDIPVQVQVQFLDTLLSVMNLMVHLSHDSRGHVIQTVSHVEIFLLLTQCQNEWIQSKLHLEKLQDMMSLLKIDTSKIFVKQNSKNMKVIPGKVEGIADDIKDSPAEPNEDGIDKEDPAKSELLKTKWLPLKTLLKIIMEWKVHSELFDSTETCAVDLVVLLWILDQVHSIPDLEVGEVGEVIQVLEQKMFCCKNGTVVCEYIAKREGQFSSVLHKLIGLYSKITEKFGKTDVVQFSQKDELEACLNRIMLTVLNTEANQVKNLRRLLEKGHEKDSPYLESVDIRKLFVEANLL